MAINWWALGAFGLLLWTALSTKLALFLSKRFH